MNRDPTRRRSRNKAVSSVIVAVLLIMIVVSAALLAFLFFTGYSNSLLHPNTNVGISTLITAQLYSSDAGIDVQGHVANFSVIISASTLQVGSVELTAGRSLVQNVSFALATGQTRTITMKQTLNQTGLWTFKVVSNGVRVASYGFNVLETQDVADDAIAQYETANFYRYMTLIGVTLAFVAFILAVASLARPPRTIRVQ